MARTITSGHCGDFRVMQRNIGGFSATRLSARGNPRRGVRRVRGCLVGNRGALRPQETRAGLLESLAGSPDLTVQGLPYGTRVRRFLSRSALRLAAPLHRWRFAIAMQPFGGQRLPAIAGALPLAGVPGLLELKPSEPFLPGAGRLHVKDGCAFHVPSLQATRASSHGTVESGDKPYP